MYAECTIERLVFAKTRDLRIATVDSECLLAVRVTTTVSMPPMTIHSVILKNCRMRKRNNGVHIGRLLIAKTMCYFLIKDILFFI